MTTHSTLPTTHRVQLSENGRIVIPAELRTRMQLTPGDVLLLQMEGEDLRITTLHAQVRMLQAEGKRCLPPGISLVDELINERRENAKKERRDS